MTGEFAGAADILTGAALARAVEPQAGEGQRATDGNCQNCGTVLVGPHCHACGQIGHVHRTLHAFGHDFLHSVLHFDGKIWRTLPMLFWRPGDLTRRYIHGERAKFVSPLALFLFTVFLTFAVFNWIAPSGYDANNVVSTDAAQREYRADRKEILGAIAQLEIEKKAVVANTNADYGWIDRDIARYRKSLALLEKRRGMEIRQTELASRKIASEKRKIETEIFRLEAQLSAAKKAGASTAKLEEEIESEKLGLKMIGNAAEALATESDFSGEWTFTDLKFPGSDRLNAAAKHASENPQLLIYKVQSNAYKYSWALIPISVPFVWLLFFWRRRFKLFDHAVFVTYSLTFMMMLGIFAGILIQFSATEVIGGLALMLPPLHIYRQLHQAYGTSRFGAFWRMCALSIFALTALTLFAALIVTLGLTG